MLKLAVLFMTFDAAFGQNRIIGGTFADITKYPYQISLQTVRGRHECGGSLISHTWVLTAAHCVDDIGPYLMNMYMIRAGSSLYRFGGQKVGIRNIIVHPHYDIQNTDNDIALVNLNASVTVSTAGLANLPYQDEITPDGQMISVTGWGLTSPTGTKATRILRAVKLPIVNLEECRRRYQSDLSYDVTDNMFCAGFLDQGGKDACQGDSGGPASIGNKVVGVVSWGSSCADPRYPGVFTQVSRYINWINRYIT